MASISTDIDLPPIMRSSLRGILIIFRSFGVIAWCALHDICSDPVFFYNGGIAILRSSGVLILSFNLNTQNVGP